MVSEYGNIDQAATKSNAAVNGRRREICLRGKSCYIRGRFFISEIFIDEMLFSPVVFSVTNFRSFVAGLGKRT